MSGRPRLNRQYELLRKIREHIETTGYPPSMRYLMTAMGYQSLSTVDYHLRQLEKEGLIRRERHLSRSITIVGEVAEVTEAPEGARAADVAEVAKVADVIKLDKRRMASQRGASNRAAAGHCGRGVDLVIYGKIVSRRDPNLQDRIDMVVDAAKRREQGHSTDVLNDYHRVAHSTLKASRVG